MAVRPPEAIDSRTPLMTPTSIGITGGSLQEPIKVAKKTTASHTRLERTGFWWGRVGRTGVLYTGPSTGDGQMPQRLQFPVLPGADDQSYWPKVRDLINFVDEARPDRKELRQFMQDQETWDRDRFEGFFDLAQVEKHGKRYRLGRVARALLDAGDQAERQLILFRRILSENPILMRCMFDALEERLFSDAELWRYLTSHVYPGDHMGGAEFREWMRWMRLCGVVRVIGIRFGFAEKIDEIKKAVGRVDVEEELMDEAEAAEGGDDDTEGDDEPAAVRDPSATRDRSKTEVEAGGSEEATPATDREDEEAPAASTAPAPASTSASTSDHSGDTATERPIAKVVPLRRAMTKVVGEAEIEDNLGRMRDWWRGFDERSLSRAEDLGVMALAYESGDKRVFLMQMVATALVVAGDPRPADRFGFFNALGRARFFHRLVDDRAAFFEVLDELEWFGDDVGQRALAENLIHVVRLRDALLDDGDLPARLAEIADPAELLAVLNEHSFTSPVEGLWLIREMVRMGLWGGEGREGIAAVAAVPSPSVVETAWRLGLHDRPQADDADEALAAAKAIAAWLGQEDGFDEPLAHFAHAHGCRRACPNAPVCPYHCREKALSG